MNTRKLSKYLTNNSVIITIILYLARLCHNFIILNYLKIDSYKSFGKLGCPDTKNNKSMSASNVICNALGLSKYQPKEYENLMRAYNTHFSLTALISDVDCNNTQNRPSFNFNFLFFVDNFFTIGGLRKLTTNLGGTLSILIICVMIPISYFKIDEVINYKNPIRFTTLYLGDQTKQHQDLYKDGFSFPYVIQLSKQVLESAELRQWTLVGWTDYYYSDIKICQDSDLQKFLDIGWKPFEDSNSVFICDEISKEVNDESLWISFVLSYDDCEVYKDRAGSPKTSSKGLPLQCNLKNEIDPSVLKEKTIMTILDGSFNSLDPSYPKSKILRELDLTTPIINKDIVFEMMFITVDTSIFTDDNKFDMTFTISEQNNYFYYTSGDIVSNRELYIYPSNIGINRVIQYKKVDFLIMELLTLLNLMVIICKVISNFYSDFIFEKHLISSVPTLSLESSLYSENLNSSEVCKIGKYRIYYY